MKKIQHCLVIVFTLLLSMVLVSDAADAGDPGKTYLLALQGLNEAKAALAASPADKTGALKTLQRSLTLLEDLNKSNPNWQPEVVAFRIQAIKDMIQKAERDADKSAVSPQARKPAEPKTLDEAIRALKKSSEKPLDPMPGAINSAAQRDGLILMLAEEVQRLRAELDELKRKRETRSSAK